MKISTKERVAEILGTAVKLAAAKGLHSITHESIAANAGVSPSLVKCRLGPMAAVRRAVMREAVERRVVRVVAEGLVAGNRIARKADADLRRACANWVERA